MMNDNGMNPYLIASRLADLANENKKCEEIIYAGARQVGDALRRHVDKVCKEINITYGDIGYEEFRREIVKDINMTTHIL